MNRREAKRQACYLCAVAIQSFVEAGWPLESDEAEEAGLVDSEGEPTKDGWRMRDAIEEVASSSR